MVAKRQRRVGAPPPHVRLAAQSRREARGRAVGICSSVIWGALANRDKIQEQSEDRARECEPADARAGRERQASIPAGPGLFLLEFSSEILWCKRRKQIIAMAWTAASPGLRHPVGAKENERERGEG